LLYWPSITLGVLVADLLWRSGPALIDIPPNISMGPKLVFFAVALFFLPFIDDVYDQSIIYEVRALKVLIVMALITES
jgi:hypothetical protein